MKSTTVLLSRPVLALVCLLGLMTGVAQAQGVDTKNDAVVFFGTPSASTKPATIDFKKVRKNTPEWKTIRTEGVTKGSARYSLLISDMTKRIKRHCAKVAKEKGNDCVVRSGDVSDAHGLKVDDLTKSVIKALESASDDS